MARTRNRPLQRAALAGALLSPHYEEDDRRTRSSSGEARSTLDASTWGVASACHALFAANLAAQPPSPRDSCLLSFHCLRNCACGRTPRARRRPAAPVLEVISHHHKLDDGAVGDRLQESVLDSNFAYCQLGPSHHADPSIGKVLYGNKKYLAAICGGSHLDSFCSAWNFIPAEPFGS